MHTPVLYYYIHYQRWYSVHVHYHYSGVLTGDIHQPQDPGHQVCLQEWYAHLYLLCSDVHHVVYIYSAVHRQQQRTYIVYVHSTLHAVQYWSHVASEMAGSTPQHPCIPWSMVCASLYLCTYVGGVYTPLHCIIACTPQDVVQVCIYTTAGMLCSAHPPTTGSQDPRMPGLVVWHI